MLLDVRNFERTGFPPLIGMTFVLLVGAVIALATQTPLQTQQSSPSPSNALAQTNPSTPIGQSGGLSVVVLDPAHGGTDLGARGAGGIRESDIVLDFAGEVRRALEQQGFQVIQTRQGNDNPSFDDRSAIANAQRGAVFVTLHISSTGLPGTVRVYVNSDMPAITDANGFIPWERAQAPFLALSRKYGDLVQGMLAQRFKGSPDAAQTGTVRQLRTTAAPAIAVEVSSVTVNDRSDLDHMAAGVGDAIARGTVAFKSSYVIPNMPGTLP